MPHHRSDTHCPGYKNVFEPLGRPCIGNGVKHWEAKRCHACSACQRLRRVKPVEGPVNTSVATDRQQRKAAESVSALKQRYTEALRTIGRQELEIEAFNQIRTSADPVTIRPAEKDSVSEGTVVMVASDWHYEEKVGREVGGLNRLDLTIAHDRAVRFFQNGLRLTRLLQQDLKITQMVLPLLGDFISNDIHEEFPETNQLTPMHAIVAVQNELIAGIEFLLHHSKLTITLPCHSGNHSRTTRTTRFGTENGHSLEYLLYLHLATYFRHEKRVQFQIAEGMHSYVDIYDTTVRFHHGHAVKYGGGVGGIYIPVNKAIGQWNKAKHADLDVFGHFHQTRDGGNFLCNGSLIGYNSFALSIKADYEPPRQTLFLLDKRRGRTCTWPILLEESK